ncbi:hypothetical protein BX600DRAFT_490920 [Xylariales sp. PMI_506]|nr:hypothetical protein BX600DRAFT_490920 [Xylariales sp. PMI_506]
MSGQTSLRPESIDGISSDESTARSPGGPATRGKSASSSSKPSCELCRIRKVKCDRAKPVCSWCARNNRQCNYRERRRTRVDGSKILDLEAKVSSLDALVQSLNQRLEDHIVSTSTDSGRQQSSYPVLSSANPANQNDDLQAGSATSRIPSTTTAPGLLDTQEQYSQSRTEPSTSNYLHNQGERQQRLGDFPNSFSPQGNTALLDPQLPSPDLLYRLVDVFFKNINPWCPLLDRQATFKTFFDSPSTAQNISEGDRVVLHAIVATALRFTTDPRLSAEAKENLHKTSSREVEIYALGHIDLYALKALTLLSLDVLGTSNGPRGQNLLALISRNTLQLDLCIERDVYATAAASDLARMYSGSSRIGLAEPESWVDDEGRRRLCWMVYILDRYATVATHSKFALDEEEMKRHLPCRYDLWSPNIPVETRSWNWKEINGTTQYAMDKPENLGSFSYHCEVLRILSRIHNFLHKPIDVFVESHIREWRDTFRSLDKELSSWLHSLPGEYGKISLLCHSDPGSRVTNWIMLHAAFVVSTIRLNSAAAYPAVHSPLFAPSYRAMQRCLAAVESLANILQDVLSTNNLGLLGPHFAFSLWVSARLLLVHAATMGGEIDSKVQFFIESLAQMGQYWHVAADYSDTLRRLTKEARRGDKKLTEMRRSAYELEAISHSTRFSNLAPTSTRIMSTNELDDLEVFDFFNYPRLTRASLAAPYDLEQGQVDYQSDWLHIEAPRD